MIVDPNALTLAQHIISRRDIYHADQIYPLAVELQRLATLLHRPLEVLPPENFRDGETPSTKVQIGPTDV